MGHFLQKDEHQFLVVLIFSDCHVNYAVASNEAIEKGNRVNKKNKFVAKEID